MIDRNECSRVREPDPENRLMWVSIHDSHLQGKLTKSYIETAALPLTGMR